MSSTSYIYFTPNRALFEEHRLQSIAELTAACFQRVPTGGSNGREVVFAVRKEPRFQETGKKTRAPDHANGAGLFYSWDFHWTRSGWCR